MSQLYPLKFDPIYKSVIWGGNKLKANFNKTNAPDKCGESWEIADANNSTSVISNGFLAGNNLRELVEIYMGDLVGDMVYDIFGNQFPLLIKLIDAHDKLSVQVHPNNELAQELNIGFGKTEMWYVIDNEKEAELINGFNKPVSKEEYIQHVENNTLLSILNTEKVKIGDVFYIPAGRVHAIGSGIVVVEIQQTSDTTYRIFDWNRTDEKGNPRQLHKEQAIKAIDFNFYDNNKTTYSVVENKTCNLIDSPYFFANIIKFNEVIEKDYNFIDSFVIYIGVEGEFEILPEEGEIVKVMTGESVLLPAAVKIVNLKPIGEAKLIEVYIK